MKTPPTNQRLFSSGRLCPRSGSKNAFMCFTMRYPVVCINHDFFFLAAKNMSAIIVTITTKIQVEKTVLVTEDQNPLSAKA